VYGKVGGYYVIHPSEGRMLEMLRLSEEIKKNSQHIVDFAMLDKQWGLYMIT
jgi:hypothetical protein